MEKIRVDVEQVDEELVREREQALEHARDGENNEAAAYRANGAKHGGVVAPR